MFFLFILATTLRTFLRQRTKVKCCHFVSQAFAEAINLKEKLKKIGVHPKPKKTKQQVEAEQQVEITENIVSR